MATTDDNSPTDDETELYQIATTADLDDVELKQGSVRLQSVDGREEFRLSDHQSGYVTYFGGVVHRNGDWNFYAERGDTFRVSKAYRQFPPAIEAVLRRIEDLTETPSDDE